MENIVSCFLHLGICFPLLFSWNILKNSMKHLNCFDFAFLLASLYPLGSNFIVNTVFALINIPSPFLLAYHDIFVSNNLRLQANSNKEQKWAEEKDAGVETRTFILIFRKIPGINRRKQLRPSKIEMCRAFPSWGGHPVKILNVWIITATLNVQAIVSLITRNLFKLLKRVSFWS